MVTAADRAAASYQRWVTTKLKSEWAEGVAGVIGKPPPRVRRTRNSNLWRLRRHPSSPSAEEGEPSPAADGGRYRQYRTNELVRRRMNFSSDAMADFEGLLEVNRKICKQQMAEKASPTLPTNCAVLPILSRRSITAPQRPLPSHKKAKPPRLRLFFHFSSCVTSCISSVTPIPFNCFPASTPMPAIAAPHSMKISSRPS